MTDLRLISSNPKQLLVTILEFIGVAGYFTALAVGIWLHLSFTQAAIVGFTWMMTCSLSSTILRHLWKTDLRRPFFGVMMKIEMEVKTMSDGSTQSKDGFFTTLGKVFAASVVGLVIAGFSIVVLKGVGIM